MSRGTGNRQPRLRCDQLDIGTLRGPHHTPENPPLPAASVFGCHRAECIADAATVIHERRHRGTDQQFPQNATLTTRNAQQLANDPCPADSIRILSYARVRRDPGSDGDQL